MTEDPLRVQLLQMLRGGNAHITFDEAIGKFPPKLRGVRLEGAPHSGWELLEHIRIAQWDILEFSRDPRHVSPEWPAGYWPAVPTPPSDAAWKKSISSFKHDAAEMERLITDPKTDLFAKIPHGTGQNILREALLVADHNAYHIGQIVSLRQLLGAWR